MFSLHINKEVCNAQVLSDEVSLMLLMIPVNIQFLHRNWLYLSLNNTAWFIHSNAILINHLDRSNWTIGSKSLITCKVDTAFNEYTFWSSFKTEQEKKCRLCASRSLSTYSRRAKHSKPKVYFMHITSGIANDLHSNLSEVQCKWQSHLEFPFPLWKAAYTCTYATGV